uniref:Uncharacterized protein n=1 Tax=Helianthus annuus TaxID=4232 RepID=A0A251SQ61_HELAN
MRADHYSSPISFPSKQDHSLSPINHFPPNKTLSLSPISLPPATIRRPASPTTIRPPPHLQPSSMSDPTSQPPLRRPTPLQPPATRHRPSLFVYNLTYSVFELKNAYAIAQLRKFGYSKTKFYMEDVNLYKVALKSVIKLRESRRSNAYSELIEPVTKIRTLRARMIGVAKDDLSKVFIWLTLEFLSKQCLQLSFPNCCCT